MPIFGTLASRASQTEGDIEISYEEYDELCRDVLALPAQSQSTWDNVILNFQYQGRKLKLLEPEVVVQGQPGGRP